jgi:DNA replication protein DnaC
LIRFADRGKPVTFVICASCNSEGIAQREQEAKSNYDGYIERLQERRGITLASVPRGVGCTCSSLDFERFVKREPFRAFGREYDASISALLCGATGLGKTSAAVAAVRRLVVERSGIDRSIERPDSIHHFGRVSHCVRMSITAKFAEAQGLINARRFQEYGKGEAGDVKFAKSADLLIIDEMKALRDNDQVIAELINERYRDGRVTVATSGLSYKGFCDHWGTDVGRRLTEAGRGCLIEVLK